MRSHFVSNPRQYHEALAKRFESRKASLTKKQLRGVLQTLGFDININSINQASSGNMSRVYLTPDLAIKIRDMKLASKKVHHFLANKVASETFYPKLPVPHVLAYDLFKKTDYEVLVMERGEGNLLSDDFLSLGEEGQTEIYGQIIDIANDLAKLRFSDWGNIRDDAAYNTFTEFVRAMFDNYCERILERRLVQKAPLEKIREYFLENIHVFDDEKKSSFIHTDLNIANVLHLGDKVTLLFDFDSSMKGPRLMLLPKLISSIDNLGEIFDGTQYRRRYCYRKFENLYPVLRNKMKDVFDDPNLVKKLNLVLILRGIRLIAKNRYEDWNSQILRDILVYELVPKGASFRRTYYGHILKKMGLSY